MSKVFATAGVILSQTSIIVTPLILRAGDTVVHLAPEAGGSVSGFQHRGRDIFRPVKPGAVESLDPLALCCFPMTPFVNRIAHGRFSFGGSEVALDTDHGRHPMHGQGWKRPWRVTGEDAFKAVLELDAGGDEWPWRYRSTQTFAVSSDALEIELAVQNRSDRRMPASVGLHPFFPDPAAASLKAATDGMWRVGEDLLPTHWEKSPLHDLNRLTPLAASQLDNCYTGFGGLAEIRWPGHTVQVSSHGCTFLQVYTRGDDGFCVEPQTAMPDPFARAPTVSGIKILDPGGSLSSTIRFTVTAS